MPLSSRADPARVRWAGQIGASTQGAGVRDRGGAGAAHRSPDRAEHLGRLGLRAGKRRSSVTLVSQREGSDLDLAEACHGMFRGYLYRFIKACAFNHVKTRYPLLGFGEWPVRFQDLAV